MLRGAWARSPRQVADLAAADVSTGDVRHRRCGSAIIAGAVGLAERSGRPAGRDPAGGFCLTGLAVFSALLFSGSVISGEKS
jgi:hypothetical protein